MTQKKIAVIGNCQSQPLSVLLKTFCQEFEFVVPPPVHAIAEQGVTDFLSLLGTVDVVVTQPVAAGYRNNIGIDTENIRSKMKPDARLILIPNLHFEGLFPTWGYMKYKSGLLRGELPLGKELDDAKTKSIKALQRSDYQCYLLLCGWLRGMTVSQMTALLQVNIDTELARIWYANSLAEFVNRESGCQTRMASVLQSLSESPNFGFHSFNHPNKALLTALALQVIEALYERELSTSTADALIKLVAHLPDALAGISLPVYPFVSCSLGLDRKDAILKIFGLDFSMAEYIEYYFSYFDCLDKDALVQNVSDKKYKLADGILSARL